MSISATNQFYVYVYLDPRKPGNFIYGEYHFDYEPFYVGKGYTHRWREHLQTYFLENDSNKLKRNKIKKIIKETNSKPIVIKYKENISEHLAFEIEISMIKTVGRIDLKDGPLTNLTDGGEGSYGRILSEETKSKISKSNLGKKRRSEFKQKRKEYMLTVFKHKPMTEEQKQASRERMIGKYKGESNPNSKYEYHIITPDGLTIISKCLKTFCEQNNLSYGNFKSLVGRNRPNIQGYKITRKLKN